MACWLVAQVDLSDLCEPLEVAGPGFINLRLRADVLARMASEVLAEPGHAPLVFDYGSQLATLTKWAGSGISPVSTATVSSDVARAAIRKLGEVS